MTLNNSNQSPIYLDYAAATPIDPEIRECLDQMMAEHYSNPSAIHTGGTTAARLLNEARSQVAELLQVRSEGVVFTGTGTESVNLAIRGALTATRSPASHLVTTAIEHPAVLETARALEDQGVAVTYIQPEASGVVSAQALERSLRPETVVVSVMYVNNELGTIQPIRDMARVIKDFNRRRGTEIVFHTDASQAVNCLPVSLTSLGVDMITLDALKFYGPRGVGILARRSKLPLAPIIYGGGQELGLRAGTENLPAVYATGLALKKTIELREREKDRLGGLTGRLREGILRALPAEANSALEDTLPGLFNFCLPGLEAEFGLIRLDQAGVRCSAASACHNLKTGVGSYVLEAIGKSDCSRSSLRLSMGRFTTEAEVEKATQIIGQTLR